LSLEFCKRKQKARSSAQSGRIGHPDQGEGLAYKKEEENGLLACEYSVLFSRDPDKTADLDPGHTKYVAKGGRDKSRSPLPQSSAFWEKIKLDQGKGDANIPFKNFCKRKQKARSSALSGRMGHPDQGEGLAYKKEEENGLLACEYSVLFSRDPDETANFFPGHTKNLAKGGAG